MRGIIENLSPENSRIDWKRIGSVFAVYVVMIAVAGTLMIQQSAKSLTHQSGVTTGMGGKQLSAFAKPAKVRSISVAANSQDD